MITRLQYVFFTCLLILGFGLSAEPHQPELLERLYEKAGLEVHLRTLKLSLKQNCQAYEGYLDPETLNQVCGSETIHITPDYYRTQMLSSLATNLDPQQVADILNWLDTPLSRRVHHMENSVEPLAAASYIRDKLGSVPPRPIRLQLVDDLIKHLNAVEISTSIASETAMKMAVQVNEVLPDDSRLELKAVEQALAEQQAAMFSASRQDLQQRFLYTYRQLPDDQLEAYVQFTQSESAHAFYQSIFDAMKSAL